MITCRTKEARGVSEAWYYSIEEGKQEGPVTTDALREMVGSGRLAAKHLVWREGMPNWAAAETVPELFPPAAPVIPAAVPLSYQTPAPQINYYNPVGGVVVYGGFWLRFAAYIIDMVILWVPQYVIETALGAMGHYAVPMSRHGIPLFPNMGSMGGLINIAMQWLYFALMESSSWQATLGKRVCGLIVTDLAGARLTFGRATGRYFGKMISGVILNIGYMMAGWTQRKQALHDMIAGTLVIRKELPKG
jgi:uncharacterized RDD family membrane protein YckC